MLGHRSPVSSGGIWLDVNTVALLEGTRPVWGITGRQRVAIPIKQRERCPRPQSALLARLQGRCALDAPVPGAFPPWQRRHLPVALLSGDIDFVPLPGYRDGNGGGSQSADGIVAPSGMLALIFLLDCRAWLPGRDSDTLPILTTAPCSSSLPALALQGRHCSPAIKIN
jgi:hypothetical protein